MEGCGLRERILELGLVVLEAGGGQGVGGGRGFDSNSQMAP